MRVVSPGWNISLPSRGEIGVRLCEGFSDRAEINYCFRAKIVRSLKIHNGFAKKARKMLPFYVLQFGALLALNFQLYGLKMTYKMFAHRNNMILASFLSSRQNKLQRKRKHAQARQLRRKARSVWFQKGRTDQWWQNMLGENATDSNWKKNFRMTREETVL